MVMLFPPAEEIALYETGFGADDLLNRRETGKRLSELLERVSQPVVIALDGPWGSGKTYFLKRWVGAHGLENDGNATTIYFDAFANDYFDDPLIGLTAALGERLPKEKAGSLGKVREIATSLLRPGLRIALAAATAGATEIAGPHRRRRDHEKQRAGREGIRSHLEAGGRAAESDGAVSRRAPATHRRGGRRSPDLCRGRA
jgi:hypothetical protein